MEGYKLIDFKDVSEVKIIDSEDGVYNGVHAKVTDAIEHTFGVDLRVSVPDGSSFWIAADSVVEFETVM